MFVPAEGDSANYVKLVLFFVSSYCIRPFLIMTRMYMFRPVRKLFVRFANGITVREPANFREFNIFAILLPGLNIFAEDKLIKN